MTNVFSILIDKKASDAKCDGDEFIVRRIDNTSLDTFNQLEEGRSEQEKKLKLPLPLSILKSLAFFAGMVVAVGILRADVTISEAYANAPEMFYIMGASWVLFGALQGAEVLKRKKHVKSAEFEEFVQDSEKAAKKFKEYLSIPDNAPLIDVFGYPYKVKKGKEKPASAISKYVNLEMFLFQDAETVYLADHAEVFAFSKSEFVKIEKFTEKVTSTGWNKETSCTSKQYKQYKITENQYGTQFYQYHYSLQLAHEGKIFEIIVPPYEIAALASLLNLTYEE